MKVREFDNLLKSHFLLCECTTHAPPPQPTCFRCANRYNPPQLPNVTVESCLNADDLSLQHFAFIRRSDNFKMQDRNSEFQATFQTMQSKCLH